MAALRDGWRRRHPHWSYRFYTDADCRDVVRRHFPDWTGIYDAYRRPIQRVDLFRYLIVYHHGGLYADMDMACFRPVDALLGGSTCVLSVEALLTRAYQRELGYRKPLQVANCIFAAAPGHPFFSQVLEKVRHHARTQAVSDRDVEDATGPRMLTRVYFSLDENVRSQIRLLPQIHLMAPTCYPDRFPFNRKVYARHHCAGTWKTPSGPISLNRRWIERNRLPRFW